MHSRTVWAIIGSEYIVYMVCNSRIVLHMYYIISCIFYPAGTTRIHKKQTHCIGSLLQANWISRKCVYVTVQRAHNDFTVHMQRAYICALSIFSPLSLNGLENIFSYIIEIYSMALLQIASMQIETTRWCRLMTTQKKCNFPQIFLLAHRIDNKKYTFSQAIGMERIWSMLFSSMVFR